MRISDWSSDVCASDLFLMVLARDVALRHDGVGQQRYQHHQEQGADEADQGGHPDVRPLGSVARIDAEIGRASCRERVGQYVSISVVADSLKQKQTTTDINYNRHLTTKPPTTTQ